VLIYWRETPYTDKWVLGRSGTASQPLTVRGVPGPAGELPVIEGNGARTRRELNYWGEARAIIKIGGSNVPADTKPSYIVIENLEVRGARSGNTFTDDGGAPTQYATNAAAIWIEKGEHIVLRRNRLHDSGNGLFVSSPDFAASRGILVEGNEISDNGNVGSGYEHNVYTEALGITFQFNHLGRLKAGANGNNLKDRSGGLIVRYNWIEGGNRQLDLVDSHNPEITGDLNYRQTFVYGNVLLEGSGDGNRQIVMYGGDSGGIAGYRKGVLNFYNNTVVSYRGDRTTLFFVPTNDESVDIRNNLVFVVAGGPSLSITDSAGRLDMWNNWFQPGFVSTFSTLTGSVTGANESIVGSSPGFVDEGARDFTLRIGSSAQNAGGALSPSAAAYPVRFQYVRVGRSATRPVDAVIDIGAYEVGGTSTDGPAPLPTPAPVPLTIATTSLAPGTVDQSYDAALQAGGGAPPYSWTISPGSLPPGVTLEGSLGRLTGIPTQAGTFTFGVNVSDGLSSASASVALLIAPPPLLSSELTVRTNHLQSAKRNSTYRETLRADGGVPPYSWAIAGDRLPPGLVLDGSTGVISGLATILGEWGILVAVRDSTGAHAQRAFEIVVKR
jgi:hypothetical protein